MIVHLACPCGGGYEEKRLPVTFTAGDRVVVLSEVAQGSCPNCGGRVYPAATLARIEAAFKAR